MSAFALFTPPRLQRLIQSDAANVARDPLLVLFRRFAGQVG